MKVKYKSHHEATGIEDHHSITMLKTRRRKIFEKQWCFYAIFAQRRPGSHMHSRILSAFSKISLTSLTIQNMFFDYLWLLKKPFFTFVFTIEFIQGTLLGNLSPKVEVRMFFKSLIPHELCQVIWNHATICWAKH